MSQDIAAGQGCALIDPHGDLASAVLSDIPRRRIDDVVVLDPSDTEQVVGINPFFRVPVDERALVAANLAGTMKHIWRDSWGPRLEYVLLNTVRALLDVETKQLRPTLLAIPRLYIDAEYRRRVVAEVREPEVRRFFIGEFDRWNDRMLAEVLAPIQNKIGKFLSNPFIRNIFGSWRPAIDLHQVVEDGKILIVRIPKGRLGEEPANLFGSVLVSSLFQAAMRREAVPEAERRDFALVIDEFHNFTTDSFAAILSEARKFGLSLTVGHQYLAQLSDPVAEAVFGNVGSVVSFRVSGDDAVRLAKEVGDFAPQTFRDLGRGEVQGRVLNGAAADDSFRGVVPLLPRPDTDYAPTILSQCHQRYAQPRAEVEVGLRRWLA